MRDDRMVEFRLKHLPGETVLMRVSAIMCLFPDRYQIRTIEHGWTIEVLPEDWDKVERAFRSAYLGGKVHAI